MSLTMASSEWEIDSLQVSEEAKAALQKEPAELLQCNDNENESSTSSKRLKSESRTSKSQKCSRTAKFLYLEGMYQNEYAGAGKIFPWTSKFR
jgi:hypothetical protein